MPLVCLSQAPTPPKFCPDLKPCPAFLIPAVSRASGSKTSSSELSANLGRDVDDSDFCMSITQQ